MTGSVVYCPKKASPAVFGANFVFATSEEPMLEFSVSFSEMCLIASLKPLGMMPTLNERVTIKGATERLRAECVRAEQAAQSLAS